MKYFSKLKILIGLLIIVSSCKKENRCDCIKRTGEIITQIRDVKNFDKIFVENNLNIFLSQDSVFEVKVEAGKNLQSLIKLEVTDDGTLYLRNKNRCNWARSYDKALNVYIKMPVIKYITSESTGNIKGMNVITTDKFDVQTKNSGDIELTVNNKSVISHMYGSGDLTLHGHTFENACDIGGTAFLNCKDLYTPYTWVHSYTSGICNVSATDLLTCIIDRNGDVICYDNPSVVQKKVNGKGNLYLK